MNTIKIKNNTPESHIQNYLDFLARLGGGIARIKTPFSPKKQISVPKGVIIQGY